MSMLVVGIAGAIAAVVIYALGAQTQLQGIAFAIAFGGVGGGLVVWANRLLPPSAVSEPWEFAAGDAAEQEQITEDAAAFHADLDRDDLLERRPFLRRLLLGGFVAIAVAAIVPIKSLGPKVGNSLRTTPWAGGRRVVDDRGRPIMAAQVPPGGVVTVFPEGAVDAADASAVLVRVGNAPGQSAGNSGLAGLFAFSKICTHAGCPVGLYTDDRRTLLCPCHQSEFDVLDGARPISGPAARPLPALPLILDDEGVLHSQGDFDAPVGPAWWTL